MAGGSWSLRVGPGVAGRFPTGPSGEVVLEELFINQTVLAAHKDVRKESRPEGRRYFLSHESLKHYTPVLIS